MTDDLARELNALQTYLGALTDIAAETQQLQQQGAEGLDDSGAVRVTLDAAGVPTQIAIEYDWQRMLDAEQLGQAVVEAAAAASKRRMEAWAAALQDSGVEERLADLGDDPLIATTTSTPPVAAPGPTGLYTDNPRPLADLAEAAIAALDAAIAEPETTASAFTPEPPSAAATFTAFDSAGQVSVSLDHDGALIGCTAFGNWAYQYDGDYLSAAMHEALKGALAHRDSARAGSTEEGRPEDAINGLLGEAMAMLRDPQRFMGA